MPHRDDHTGGDDHADIITRGKESPPLTLGPQRVHYQFSVALPQIHLTFVSILQGIALYVLLVNMPLPNGTTLQSVLVFVGTQYAYLPYVISGALILVIWKQFVEATMFYIWPLSSVQLGLELLISASEIIAFREVRNFGAWIVCLSIIGWVGGAIRLNNLRLRSRQDFESLEALRRDIMGEVVSGVLYIALGSVVFGAVIAVPLWPSYSVYAQAIHWAALGVLTVIVLEVIALDQAEIMRLVEKAIAIGDICLTPQGGLTYRTEKSQPQATGTSESAGEGVQ